MIAAHTTMHPLHREAVAEIQVATSDPTPVDEAGLDAFTGEFVRLLGSIHTNLTVGPCIVGDGVTGQTFVFGTEPEPAWIRDRDGDVVRKMYAECGVEIFRFYSGNTVTIIARPDATYWTKAHAVVAAFEALYEIDGMCTDAKIQALSEEHRSMNRAGVQPDDPDRRALEATILHLQGRPVVEYRERTDDEKRALRERFVSERRDDT
jgi:hypothetical protein